MAFDGHYDSEEIPPFLEAVDWFLEQQVVTQAELAALSAEARQRAFTVARVYAADELLTVYDAVLAGLYKGTGLAEFSKATQHLLPNRWHRETVFRTNLLSAYGAGHWEQAQAVKELRPFACFRAAIAGRTSPGCYRLRNTTLPLDHPYVRANWCPRHFN